MSNLPRLFTNCYKTTYTRKDKRLDFAAMDEFMDFILGTIKDHGSTAVRVFPPASHVLLLFSERLSSEVVSEAWSTCSHCQFF